jgi:hypothetical protein
MHQRKKETEKLNYQMHKEDQVANQNPEVEKIKSVIRFLTKI